MYRRIKKLMIMLKALYLQRLRQSVGEVNLSASMNVILIQRELDKCVTSVTFYYENPFNRYVYLKYCPHLLLLWTLVLQA